MVGCQTLVHLKRDWILPELNGPCRYCMVLTKSYAPNQKLHTQNPSALIVPKRRILPITVLLLSDYHVFCQIATHCVKTNVYLPNQTDKRRIMIYALNVRFRRNWLCFTSAIYKKLLDKQLSKTGLHYRCRSEIPAPS